MHRTTKSYFSALLEETKRSPLGSTIYIDEVVGYSQLPGNTGAQNAFLYKNGKLIDLDPNPKDFASWATGINHYGQIAGYAANSQTTLAFLYKGGKLTYLPSLSGPTGTNIAFGINDLADVVGISYNANYWAGFLFRNGSMKQIGIAYPLAINNLGQIVGISGAHAALYQSGSLVDLGTLDGSQSQAYAINNLGQIVGLSFLASGERHAFLYENGTMKDLGGVGARHSDFGRLFPKQAARSLRITLGCVWTS
jgi:probable HAF family extracellular repeat protein